jgi:hypothetical protein
MTKIITKEKLKEMILEITEMEYRFMSIREITTKLQEKYGIKKSPQTIKILLEELEKGGKLQKE